MASHANGHVTNGVDSHHSASNGNTVNGNGSYHGTHGSLNDSPYQNEAIAIVGMACHLPGGIGSADDLWDFLCDERSAKSDVPISRFNIDAFYNPLNELPDTVAMRGGYFINEDLRLFDNAFFKVNNLEATNMDPQMRKLLEVCYECLESAGIRLSDVAGKNVGCYVGNFTVDYQTMCGKDPGHQHRLAALAMSAAVLSNRVSYLFDLMGPSLTLDTACSSSLYCLHLAVNALRKGDCDSAFVGGANLIQSFEQYMHIARFGFLSRTSQCHSFDSSADGYGRADGVGALYLKRLSDALRDGDPIRSIIRGTAINSNGKTSSNITVPSTVGQKQVIAKAYADAGIDPTSTDYIECHGTGTQVGDVIEVTAVTDAMRMEDPTKPLFIGSVKTNLGHSEASSGITSIIKVTMALERQWIPPTIGVTEPNPKIDWKKNPVHIVTSGMPWPTQNVAQRASINSFGFGGANGHCILERYSAGETSPPSEDDGDYPAVLPLSAASMFSLHQRVKDLCQSGPFPIRDLSYTLANRRSALPCRGYIIAEDSQWQQDFNMEHFKKSVVQRPEAKPLAFVFTGQGAQWADMGRRLFHQFPIFQRTILELDETLDGLADRPEWSLAGLMNNANGKDWSASPLYSQAACTALQVGLVNLLEEWRVLPRYVTGHSGGEIAAAYAAGHISASAAIVIAYRRGVKVSALSTPGAMVAAGIGADEADAVIQRLDLSANARVCCINSPESVTISGDEVAVNRVLDELAASKSFARKLKTGGVAYHSHHMEAIGKSYQQCLEPLFRDSSETRSSTSSVEMISTVYGRVIDQQEAATAAYWRSNLELPVQFRQAIESLQELDTCQIIEIGPHSALELPIKQTLSPKTKQQVNYLSSITRNQDTSLCLLHLAGNLWCRGYDIDLDTINRAGRKNQQPRALSNLPKYPWDYTEPFWTEPRRSIEYRKRTFAPDELLGTLVPGISGSGSTFTWRNKLMVKDAPWIADHRLSGEVVFPAAAYIDMAVKAVQQLRSCQDEYIIIRNMRLPSVLVLSNESEGIEISTEFQQEQLSNVEDYTASWTFTISTWADGKSVKRAAGVIGMVPLDDSQLNGLNGATTFPQGSNEDEAAQKSTSWYRQFSKVGIEYGPKFQVLSAISNTRMRDQCTTRAEFENLKTPLDPYQNQARYKVRVHPTIVDGIFQTGLIAHTSGNIEELQGLLPNSINHLRFHPRFSHEHLASYSVRTYEKSVAAGLSVFESQLVDDHGRIIVDMLADAKWFSESGFQAPREERFPFLRIDWVPDMQSISSISQGEALASLVKSDEPHADIMRLLHIASMNRCDANVLVVSSDDVQTVWTSLGGGTAYPRFSQLTFANEDADGVLQGYTIDQITRPKWEDLKSKSLASESTYDIVIDMSHSSSGQSHRLAPDGLLICSGKQPDDLSSISHVAVGSLHLIRNHSLTPPPFDFQAIIIITDDTSPQHPFNTHLCSHLQTSTGIQPSILSLSYLSSARFTKSTLAIVTAELLTPVLTVASPTQLSAIQTLVSRVPRLLWIAHAHNPDMAAVLGLARTVMLENPGVSFQVLGVEVDETETQEAIQCVEEVLRKQTGLGKEQGFLQRGGLLHVSRFVPNEKLNEGFNEIKGGGVKEVELGKTEFLEMDIGLPGQFDTLRFRELREPPAVYGSDIDVEVDIQVMAIGLNAKDLYALSGKVKTPERAFANDYAGIVKKTRPGSKLAVGDRVAWLSAGPFATVITIPEGACIRLRDDESFTQMATVPLVFITAVYALEDRARLQSHESVLIHSAAGGVGMAAIQVAKNIGATIYATVGTDEKRDFLVAQFGLRREHIFNSRDTSFLDDVKRATSGRGVDVVLNSLTGERFRAGLAACATFGRFVEIGKKDIMDCGNLNLADFGRSLTFTALDLNDHFFSSIASERLVLPRLLKRGFDVFRSNPLPPPRVFNVGQLSEAYRAFANSKRVGKICVSFEDSSTLVKVQPTRYRHRFSPNKAYLLIGCLGGVGRSLTRYMFENGARRFVFLSKSGTEKPAAELLVKDLLKRTASVDVIKGDVLELEDVRRAVAALSLPLGGVVQAAMVLDESLFENMTHEKWHATLGPKVQGTWNLHRATEGHETDLDFFLMISSLTGSTGSIAESNYTSANSFLDSFAAYRHQLGKVATALAFGYISGIGYLHEHPEVEELMKRKGLTPITEADLLDMCDVAFRSSTSAHILTGLEGVSEIAARRQGFAPELADPRASILVHGGKTRLLSGGDGAGKISTFGSEGGLPPVLQDAIDSKDHDRVVQAVVQVLTEKLSKLILTPVESIPVDMTLANAGVDSMLAAELRSFVFHTLKTDIPFITLMDAQTTMMQLAVRIADKLLE